MNVAQLQLRPERTNRLAAGHPWIYHGEIATLSSAAVDGGEADVYDSRNRFLGRALLDLKSQITARLLTDEREPIDETFLRKRITQAVRYRDRLGVNPDCCRIVFSEGDRLGGLIIDRYNKTFVVQSMTSGMDARLPAAQTVLQEMFNPSVIYERSDGNARERIGLPVRTGFLMGEGTGEQEVVIGDVRMHVDCIRGQKTGMFLDQADNAPLVRRLAANRHVLDCFCYTGLFALHSAIGEAHSVRAIDVSLDALTMAEANAKLNGLSDQIKFTQANVFDALRSFEEQRTRFGMVILDPPAFCKNKQSVPAASRGYKEINLRAMRILEPGGILVTVSCSFHMLDAMFVDLIADAAADCRRKLRIIHQGTQSRDHPYLLGVPETRYLKFYVFELLN